MWRKLNGEHLKKPIVDEVEQTLKREHELGNKLKVCIGTDSQVYGNTIEFATVIVFVIDKIVFRRIANGGNIITIVI